MIENVSNNDVANLAIAKENRLLELRKKERKLLNGSLKEELQILSLVKPNYNKESFDFDFNFIRTHYGMRGEGVNVFVLDTGIDNPTISCTSKSFISSSPKDDFGHGTIVSKHIMDAAPLCNLTSLKVLDGSGTGKSEFTTKALEWILKQKSFPHIVHMSHGGSKPNPTQERLIWQLYRKGSIVIVSEEETKLYPAKYDGVVSVSIIDKSKSMYTLLDCGAKLQLSKNNISIRPCLVGFFALGLSYALKKDFSPSENLRDIVVKSFNWTGKQSFLDLKQSLLYRV